MEESIELQKKWVAKAIRLSWFTISYNLVEGVVSIWFGVAEDSVALAGFGADSLIEVASAFLVLWRFQGTSSNSDRFPIARERSATIGIGILFIFLALITVFGALSQLRSGIHPTTTLPGLVVSTLSLSFMFYLWRSKERVGKALNSPTVLKDAECSLACIKLSFILFGGSLVYMTLPGLWWADSVAALLLSFFIAKEGIETVQAARKSDFAGGCGCH